jgi:hypothetical protein
MKPTLPRNRVGISNRAPGLRSARFVVSANAWIAFVLAPGGCSSTSSSPPAPTPCAVTPTPPADDSLCMAMASYDGRCGHCDDCTAKNLQNCTKLGSTMSDAYRAAYVACKDSAPCGADPAFSSCVVQRMKSATPTTAQDEARADYCNRCNATNASDCASFFSADPILGKNGPGYSVLLNADQVATMALTTCANECDPFRYGVCVALVACGPSGGDFCADGGFCAAH